MRTTYHQISGRGAHVLSLEQFIHGAIVLPNFLLYDVSFSRYFLKGAWVLLLLARHVDDGSDDRIGLISHRFRSLLLKLHINTLGSFLNTTMR